ncbi:MAG: glutathione synthase [Proteobacteria bacterium]|nr:glutathione synthase [Pseudomonadota bacterium]
MRIALQMDPMERVKRASDSTFALGFAAQERGHTLWHYTPSEMTWQSGKLSALARPLTLHAEGEKHFCFFDAKRINLADDVDVILLRQDPPFDMPYLTTTYLLDLVKEKVRVFNDPTGVRSAPEKLLTTHFFHLIPPTLISVERSEIRAFSAAHPDLVVKRLYGHAGNQVWHVKAGDSAFEDLLNKHFSASQEPLLFQPFLPEVMQGDKRIILFGGKPVGAVNRVPAKGEFRANFAQGGKGEACKLSPRDLEICAQIAPMLKLMGLYFVGIDVIGPWLSEINTTSPTGLVIINQLYGFEGEQRLEHLFWRKLGL